MTESQQFLLSAFLALLIEFSVLGILGHKRQIQQEPAFFAETELLEMPKKLVSEKKTTNKILFSIRYQIYSNSKIRIKI
jgi:hypothetical protein